MNIGEKISIERKRKGFSQELLAENSGISLRTIQRIENSVSKPRPYTLKVIADTLNMEMANFDGEQNPLPKVEAEFDSLSKISLINSSALFGILIPFFNIIVPIIFWKKNNMNQLVRKQGKRIISFQILWVLFTTLILFLTHFIHFRITGQFISGRLPIVFVVYGILLLVNIFFIIKTSIQLGKGKTDIYPFIPNLF